LFGTCNEALCQSLGDCYYDDMPNGIIPFQSACIHRRDMACRYYDTQHDCVGEGTGVNVDIIYTPEGLPIGGTHSILEESQDLFRTQGYQEGFGNCQWIENAGTPRCLKNSDDHYGTPFNPQDDCEESGYALSPAYYPACLRDDQPPTTTLLLKQHEPYGLQELTGLPYYVSDNLYSASHIKTAICLAPQGDSCYPNILIRDSGNLLSGIDLDPGEEGTYELYYSSKDPSGNYEPIKHARISIQDLSYPYLIRVIVE
ncbi:MAG: hypothetical protein HC945_00590, partial [Nitrosarchaeum sp.]|nr:hypothetical protein [Nitrosarchaeum sp.]